MTATTTLPDYGAALAAALDGMAPIAGRESIALGDGDGRVLAEALACDRDLPPFDRAQMDGYALRAADLGDDASCTLPVVGTAAAGAPFEGAVPAGACVKIATGAPLPPELDTVVQHELTDRGDPVTITAPPLEPGHAVHRRGSDATAGAIVVPTLTELRPHHLGIAASIGASTLSVVARPRVTILTSGDEVRDVADAVAPHQIRNSNAVQSAALVARLGGAVVRSAHVVDDLDATTNALRTACAESDLVITHGGVSAGERDYFPAAFDAANVTRRVHGAAIQPGKPVIVGAAPDDTTVVALPGNPVSSLACAALFVWPIVRAMLGLDAALPWRTVSLTEAVRPNHRRRAFRPAILGDDGITAVVPAWSGSGDLVHTAPTHGLIELPVQNADVVAGTVLRFLPWPTR